MITEQKIIFFDGVCNLCNHFVDFVIRQDKKQQFYFAPLQGLTAQQRLPIELRKNLPSIVLLEQKSIFTESTAILKILTNLSFKFTWLKMFYFVPKILRNSVYRWVAHYRYQMFGKRDNCRVPTVKEKSRFLD